MTGHQAEVSEVDYSIPGLRIAPAPPDSGYALVIRSATPQEGWVEWQDLSHIISPALHYLDRYWCIASVEQVADSWVYWLAPWPEHRTVRKPVELTPEAWQERQSEEAQLKLYRQSQPWALPTEIAIAWLPRRTQEWMALRFAIRPERGVFIHGLLMLAITAFLGLSAFQTWSLFYAMIALYCVIDAGVRMLVVVTSGEATGLLPLEVIDAVLQLFDNGDRNTSA